MKISIKTIILTLYTLFFNSQIAFAQCHFDDWEALKALYENTNGKDWDDNTNWEQVSGNGPISNCNLELLYGVSLDNQGRVETLVLYNNQLNGSIPRELGSLSNLRVLDLGASQLSGRIPAELGNLINLTKLWLPDNQLSGNIPFVLGNLNNLTELSLGGNLLFGNIPPELGSLSNLTKLWLSDNQLSGNIPYELGNLNKLIDLRLSHNQLYGSIPPELANLSKLKELRLSYNQLYGSIPAELGNLSFLEGLWLSNNQLSGSIPLELGNLSYLYELHIENNYFSCQDVENIYQQNQLTYSYSPQYYTPLNFNLIRINVFDTLSVKKSLSLEIDFPFETSGLANQWYRNGKIIPGATQASLNFNTVLPNDVGKYTLRVYNKNCLPDETVFELVSEPIYVIIEGYDLEGQTVEYSQIMVEFENIEETKRYENKILFPNAGWVKKACNCNRELYVWQFPSTETTVAALMGIDKQTKIKPKKNEPTTGFNNLLNIGEIQNDPVAYNIFSDTFNSDKTDSVTVFMLDTGLDVENFDGALNYLYTNAPIDSCYNLNAPGYNYVMSETESGVMNEDYTDQIGVGTFGYGIISEGLEGVNNAKIVPLKTFDDTGQGNLFDLTCALYHAIDHGADIINISGSYTGESSKIIENALNIAREKGIFIVCPAGNDGLNIDNEPSYPGYYASQYHYFYTDNGLNEPRLDSLPYSNIITVAAVNINNQLGQLSNFGKHSVTLAAPGENILGKSLKGIDVVYTGTTIAGFFTTQVLASEIASNNSRTLQETWADFENNYLVPNANLTNVTRTGKQIKFDWEEPDIYGCTDVSACNYFSFATIDDGTCQYCVDDSDFTMGDFCPPCSSEEKTDVYPGDLNHDGIVDHVDHGLLGLYKTEIGSSRAQEHRNIDWYPHPAEDWGTQQLNNEDIKHYDCNGDGFVDDKDRVAVEENMGEIWTTPIPPPPPPNQTDYQVMLYPVNEISDSYVVMNIALERRTGDDLTLQGGYFTIDYSFIEDEINYVVLALFEESWLGSKEDNLKFEINELYDEQKIEIGFTKTNNMNSIGNGVIGDLILSLNTTSRLAKTSNNTYEFQINTIGVHNGVELTPIEDQVLQIDLNNNCQTNWKITEETPVKNQYKSTNLIETEGLLIIRDEQQVEYRSNNVYLQAGFEVKMGASFRAGNGSCD